MIKAGGPVVKNVSGFDLCRLMVGSLGTLGLFGEVVLRTRPVPAASRWFSADLDPFDLVRRLHRPTSVLWNGTTTWVLLEGDEQDVEAQVAVLALQPAEGAPPLPAGGRWSIPPGTFRELTGEYIVEIGVGIVHHAEPPPVRPVDPAVAALHRRIKEQFDPAGRLNPGVDVLAA